MFRRTDRRWRQARTLADLGALTADWLDGRLSGGHPGGYDRPDEETLPLIPVLAAANRVGLVTDDSQPGFTGRGHRDQRLEQRAAVDGWMAPGPSLDRIVRSARAAGLYVVVHGAPHSVVVTRLAGQAVTSFGRCLSDSDLRRSLPGLHRDAYTALYGATRLAIADPVWGPSTCLWDVLGSAVSGVRS